MGTTDKDALAGLLAGETPPVAEALEVQRVLREKVISTRGFGELKTIAGADLAVLKGESRLLCGIIVLSYPEMNEIERVSAVVEEKFPYIPGLLAFREGPAIIETYKRLELRPDLLMVDGQGIAHPRGFGIACHVGVLLDVPTLGVAKKRLYGRYDEPGEKRGSWTPLLSPEGGTIGSVLRTRDGVKPVFVSVGHKIDLDSARDIALACAKGYRIPEPTRRADKFAAEMKRGAV